MAWNLTATSADARRARDAGAQGYAAPAALTVSEALAYAKGALEARTLVVEGEVSSVSDKPGYKGVYFTVADDSAPMDCMMWRNRYVASGLALEKGKRVRVTGRFTVYAAKGRMQFEAFALAPAGEGDLRQRVDRLARRLASEGLTDPARKRRVPWFCSRVAVVTSPRGKAVHDVIRTLRRRNPLVELLVCGVAVEGADAPRHIVEGLEVAAQAHPDAILLVRGGGSYEDLMPFNDESVARAVAASPVPVVTGIGHEPDTTICDMVADLRRSNPTNAAEAVAPTREELSLALEAQAGKMAAALSSQLSERRRALEAQASRPVLADPARAFVSQRALALDAAADRLSRAMPDALEARRVHADALARRLSICGPRVCASREARADADARQLRAAGAHLLAGARRVVAEGAGRLEALSPLAVIARGYAMACDERGRVISSAGQVAPGDGVSVRLADGVLDCAVREVRPLDAPVA